MPHAIAFRRASLRAFLRALPEVTERLWARRGPFLLRFAIALELGAAAVWLAYQLWRLLSAAEPIWPSSPRGAVDIERHQAWARLWFEGIDPYLPQNTAPLPVSTHPPASYLLFWPFLGWLGFAGARCLWAATSLAALAWLARLVVRESGVSGRLERTFIALLPAALYPAGATIGNGQLALHLLPLLVVAALTLERSPPGLARDATVGIAFLAALAKPSLTAPFFWIVLFAPGGARPAFAVAAGYALLTLAAGAFQTDSLATLLGEWADHAVELSASAAVRWSHGNLHGWLTSHGLERWNVAAAVVVLGALAIWIARHRSADVWLQLGVTALVTRLLSYHGWYDDLLIVLPLVALLRLARAAAPGSRRRSVAGGLIVVAFPLLLAPGGQYLLPPPWKGLFLAAQVALWIAMLVALLVEARAFPPTGRSEAALPAATPAD